MIYTDKKPTSKDLSEPFAVFLSAYDGRHPGFKLQSSG